MSLFTSLVARIDSLYNTITGMGTSSRDRRLSTKIGTVRQLEDEELAALFRANHFARRIVSAKPEEALRKGWELTFGDEADGERKEAIDEEAKELGVREAIVSGAIWGRLYGGAAIYVVADDGRPEEEELDEERIRSIHGLHMVDRRDLTPLTYDRDPVSRSFGEPLSYQLSMTTAGDAVVATVHRSRLILFGGVRTDRRTRLELNGWDDSALQPVWETLRDVQSNWAGVSQLMQDASVGVLKLKNLVDMVSSQGSDPAFQARLRLLDMSKSVFRSLLIDQDETYERVEATFAGIPELTREGWVLLSAAAEMPVTVLMGQSPAGLNATGESDSQNWEKIVETEQQLRLKAPLMRLLRLLMLAKEGPTGGIEPAEWDLRFPPLRIPTPAEEAEVRLKMAQVDSAYIDRGVSTPEEVALSRFGGTEYSIETEIDVALREELRDLDREAQLDRAKHPPPPPPPGVPPGAPPPEPEPAEPEPAPDPEPSPGPEPAEPDVDKAIEAIEPTEALNGAQVTALRSLLIDVAAGALPRENAIELIIAAFPIEREQADRLLGALGTPRQPRLEEPVA